MHTLSFRQSGEAVTYLGTSFKYTNFNKPLSENAPVPLFAHEDKAISITI